MANETITGKIFTLKDPTGTYNRFPRTVMEAVYGLNTYLQNQFGALADIYMPIEGITEIKPLQEFVYRLCPSTIKAKSLTLDRIYGKTLAWNQQVKQDVVVGGDTYQWNRFDSNITLTANDKELQMLKSSGYGIAFYLLPAGTIISGHTYYLAVDVKTNAPTGGISVEAYGVDTIIDAGRTFVASSNWQRLACIKRCATATNQHYRIRDNRSSDFDTVYAKNFAFIDLTLMFGAGNEPSTVAEFESMFPGYHDYEPGKLISNDAESIETVGFNLWDEEWELGSYDNNTGEPTSGSFTVRSKSTNPIPCLPSTTYFIQTPQIAVIFFYDNAGNFISPKIEKNKATFVTPANCYYIKFRLASDYGATYNHDICINLSDPAKNGTYEPYRKSTMQLNLGSFQVRDSQGNVTTITGGLKSAGSVRDEIVGNKYIKRVGSVDLGSLEWTGSSSTRFVSSGVSAVIKRRSSVSEIPNIITENGYTPKSSNTDSGVAGSNDLIVDGDGRVTVRSSSSPTGLMNYELATPVEYTLVSPLVPTVKAGITEARISPNADGLSAPMVADMTYDAQANNDSASAQYALTAGRLLNSHKLWGQDFDGTQDVSGALTGVTSINSLLYLGSTNVGIGQSNPQYKLDVSGTARITGAVTLGSTLSVAGNTTIGGTLGVTGATTLTGSLTANGAVSINNTLTVGTSQTNRATTLNGTLTVSGLTSIAGGLKLTTTKKIWFDDTHYLELLTENGTQYLHTNLNVVSDAGVVAGASANS